MMLNRLILIKPSRLSYFLIQIIDSRRIAVNNLRRAQEVTNLYNEKGECHDRGLYICDGYADGLGIPPCDRLNTFWFSGGCAGNLVCVFRCLNASVKMNRMLRRGTRSSILEVDPKIDLELEYAALYNEAIS